MRIRAVKSYLPFLLLLVLAGAQIAALGQGGSRNLVLEGALAEKHPEYGEVVHLCLNTPVPKTRGAACDFSALFPQRVHKGRVALPAEGVCQAILEGARVISPSGEWFVSSRQHPGRVLYRLDCRSNLAWQGEREAKPQKKKARGRRSASRDRRSPVGGLEDEILRELEEIESQLRDLKAQAPPTAAPGATAGSSGPDLSHLDPLIAGQRRLLARIVALEDRLDTLSAALAHSCQRLQGTYEGREEVVVSIGGVVMRFLRVSPQAPVPIGLSDEVARGFLQEAQERSPRALLPSIYRSVPEVLAPVEDFFIQERLIAPRLYRAIMGESEDPRRVSFEQAGRFVAELNTLCEGKARFNLPTEGELVAVARLLYDPVRQGLRECSVLRWAGASLHVTQLFGHHWQLTRSPCAPFSQEARIRCAQGSYVRKGGSESSTNPLECVPQFRGESPPDVAQKNTTFRLVLVQ